MGDNQAIATYSYRLRPGSEAKKRLEHEWNCARWVWNRCVEEGSKSHEAFKRGEQSDFPTLCRMSKKLTAWRREHEWLRSGSRCAQGQTVRKWSVSHQRAMRDKSVGFPDFKSSKWSKPSIEYYTLAFKIVDKRLWLVGDITIPVVWSRDMPSNPKSCVICRDSLGHWSASFFVRRKITVFEASCHAIGIDWGLSKIATTTDTAHDLDRDKVADEIFESLKKSHRKISRRVLGSRGRERAKRVAAKKYAKIANRRRDRAFKWASRVVSSFGNIAIEDFKTLRMWHSYVSRSAFKTAIGINQRILISKAKSAGRNVVLVPPAYTTQTCSQCGSRNKTRLKLNNRTFVCESCGHTADRDRNAAWTILARAGFNPTNVDDVRPSHDFGCVAAV